MKVKDGERLDTLVRDGMKLIQREDQFRFSLDTVLLANFGSVPHSPVLDLGTGTGAIPLILTARGVRAVTALELNPIMADIAARNVILNHKEESIRIKHGDYRQPGKWLKSGSFAAVYANPPYREKQRGAYSTVPGIRRARHEETATLAEVLAAASFALKYGGYFRMVHIVERLADIFAVMRYYKIEPKRLLCIHGRLHKQGKICIIEGIRGGNPGLEVLPPLMVHNQDGSYSKTVLQYYGVAETRHGDGGNL